MMDDMLKYREWEDKQGISPCSPEAHYAELAWNAALKSARSIMQVNESVRDVLDSLITDLGES